MQQIMQQAQAMQQKMMQAQQALETIEVVGVAGGGMVSVTLNGKNEAKRVQIDAALMQAEEKDVLEDLIVAAINDARNKVEEETQGKMAEATSGLQLPPGFKLPW